MRLCLNNILTLGTRFSEKQPESRKLLKYSTAAVAAAAAHKHCPYRNIYMYVHTYCIVSRGAFPKFSEKAQLHDCVE